MPITVWCVLVAGLMPYLAAATAKAGAKFDNNHPRDWLAKQEGYRRRANAAQANAFEAFPLFAVAVLVAMTISHAPQHKIDMLALGFVVARVAYMGCYIANWPNLRSLCWAIGMVCTITIFVG